MKRGLVFLLAALPAISTIFSSCNKSNDATAEREVRDVLVKIDKVSSRSISPGVTDPTLVFNSGYLYFVSGSGQITGRLGITDDNAALTATSVGIETLQAGVIISVPANTLSIYLPGNVPASITLPTSGAYSAVEQTVISLNDQYDVSGGITAATIYGGSPIIPPVAPSTVATADIDVRPLASRIEISAVTGGTGIAGSWIIEGIFINKYDGQQYLNATRNTADFRDNGIDPTDYLSGAAGYPAVDNGKYFDYNASGVGTLDGGTNAYTPAVGNVWSYNVFAGLVPHIVIRLDDITDFPNPQFLTVKTFRTSGGTLITSFERGKIYRITNIAFTADDLSEQPELETLDVEVTVNLIDWTFEDGVQPGF